MAELTGSELDAAAIYALEYALAEAMKSRVEMRDADKRYNPMTVSEWQALAPSMPVAAYMAELGLDDRTVVNSASEFFSRMEAKVADFSLDTWKQYHKWHIINGASGALNDALEAASFEFYQKTLRGKPKMNPRWKRSRLNGNVRPTSRAFVRGQTLPRRAQS